MEQPYSDIERQELEFERKYKTLLSDVGHGRICAEKAYVMLILDYEKLKKNPNASRDCVYAGREHDILEALTLAEERARLGMDDSATKSLAQLAEEKIPEREKTFSWLVPVCALGLAFGLFFISGDRSRVPDSEIRAPGEIRQKEFYQPQFLRDDYKKKEPVKEEKKQDSAPERE
ncbi:MAG: hypothetical protein QXT19_04995 [Candidatus Woesearchaeota archaeon]